MRLLVYICLLISFSKLQAQDSIPVVEHKKNESVMRTLFSGTPGRALAYSLILPGSGQIYNKDYWKVPFVYVAYAVPIGLIYFNRSEFKKWDLAFHQKVDKVPITNPEIANYSLNQLNAYRKYYDKNLQRSYLALGAVYLLSGIEAFVANHLQSFDVSDDLSIRFSTDLSVPHEEQIAFAKIPIYIRF